MAGRLPMKRLMSCGLPASLLLSCSLATLVSVARRLPIAVRGLEGGADDLLRRDAVDILREERMNACPPPETM